MQRDLAQINRDYETYEVDQWSSDWRGSLALWHDLCIAHIMEDMKKQFDRSSSISILDIGCGSGILTEKIYFALSQYFVNIEYTAVDIAEKAIEKAYKLHKHTKVHYQVVTEDLALICSNSYHIILGFQFLSYLDSSERRQIFNTVNKMGYSNTLFYFSCNIQTEGNHPDYINSDLLANDFRSVFYLASEYDVFIAQFGEYIERKIYRYSKIYLIKLLLQSTFLPKIFNSFFLKRATLKFPQLRMRLYLLKANKNN